MIDGNYQGKIGRLAWERADAVVWLDLPRWQVMRQVVTRTLIRALDRRALWNGNRESWAGFALWRRDESVIWWAWTSYPRVKRMYETALADASLTHLKWHRLRDRKDLENFLEKWL
ncbi:hypothetical protein [Nocardioides sp. Kera G14]|uniref:hypothetical protein n=1 Tax=Nocardioides sp. Kera G14 TaxID=2884264 RepID=UPI001D10F50A|nr:hypothetical protein [Nocardioides sp. Kera G14]UDY24817.1 hypothetical protein LH076_05825 [Nocardioides sp. Kera G14]